VLYLAAYNRLVSFDNAFALALTTCTLLSMTRVTSACKQLVRKWFKAARKNDIGTGFQKTCADLSNQIRNKIVMLEQMEKEKSKRTDHVRTMIKINTNISAILDDSVVLMKWHSGQLRANFVSFPIARLFNSIASYATEKGLDVGGLPPIIPTCHVTADEHLLNKAATNLISNAYKYGQGYPMSVVMAFEKTDDEEGVIVVTVADKGCGMTPDQLHKLTRPFTNIRTGDEVKEGTGLSLFLAKAMIELGHKGSLLLESEGIGKGVTATIRVLVQWEDRTDATRPNTDDCECV